MNSPADCEYSTLLQTSSNIVSAHVIELDSILSLFWTLKGWRRGLLSSQGQLTWPYASTVVYIPSCLVLKVRFWMRGLHQKTSWSKHAAVAVRSVPWINCSAFCEMIWGSDWCAGRDSRQQGLHSFFARTKPGLGKTAAKSAPAKPCNHTSRTSLGLSQSDGVSESQGMYQHFVPMHYHSEKDAKNSPALFTRQLEPN